MAILILCAGILLLLLSVMPYLPVSNIVTDTASHFVLQYLIAAVALTTMAAIFKSPGIYYTPLVLTILLTAAQIVPLLPIQSGSPALSGKPFKVLQANVLKFNRNTEKLAALITREDPDVIVLAEVTSAYLPLFSALQSAYPAQEVIVQDQSSFGMAVLSKTPMQNIDTHYFANDAIASIEMETALGGRSAHFLSIHPANPLKDFAARDAELENIGNAYHEKNDSLIIVGDFNATPYCPAFKAMRNKLALTEARAEHGVMGSYPTASVFDFLRIPIDHLLTGSAFTVIGSRLGPDIGSDHLPVITTLGWKAVQAKQPPSR